ncbi:uncharacterized protein [Miscanthus floridulus]|uniref:uncharacterized protein n=1 Tax=Miscanthus floridulus TaxID=154761 RepID=UPI003459C464
MELGRPAASHANVVVEIPSDDEADTMAEPPVSPRELAVVRSEAGPSSGSSEGHAVVSELTKLSAKLENARKQAQFAWVESACRESQVRATEVATVRAEGQRTAERATAAKQGLEATKVHQEETEAGLRMSLVNIEAALQEALAALEPERAALESTQKALEVEQRARSEAD